MNLDIEDVIASAVGSVIGRFVLFIAAVWLGCAISMVAVINATNAGLYFEESLWLILLSPFLLFSAWAVLNIPFLIFYLFRFLRGDGDSYRVFGLLIAVESVVCLLGYGIQKWPEFIWTLVSWGILLAAVELIIWQIRSQLIRRWEHGIQQLREENARRTTEKLRVERERMSLESV